MVKHLVLAAMLAQHTFSASADPLNKCDSISDKTIRRSLDELAAAVGGNDLKALGAIWSDDYRYVRKDGVVLDKNRRLDRVKNGIARHDLVRYEDPELRCYGDTALVMTRTISRSEGKEAGPRLQVTHVLVRQKTIWRVVMTHATAIADVPID